jgi:hypothetical protein
VGPEPGPAPLVPWTAAQLASLEAMAASLELQASAIRQQVGALRVIAEGYEGGPGTELSREAQRMLTRDGQGPEFYGGFSPGGR